MSISFTSLLRGWLRGCEGCKNALNRTLTETRYDYSPAQREGVVELKDQVRMLELTFEDTRRLLAGGKK